MSLKKTSSKQPIPHTPKLCVFLAVLFVSGCWSFDQDGYLYYDPPRADSGSMLVSDLKERIAKHDNEAVKELLHREFEALHGNDPAKLLELKDSVDFLAGKAPFIPGIAEYQSWLESRVAYFEAAEAARIYAAQELSRQHQLDQEYQARVVAYNNARNQEREREFEIQKRLSEGWIEKDGIYYPSGKKSNDSVASLPRMPEEYRVAKRPKVNAGPPPKINSGPPPSVKKQDPPPPKPPVKPESEADLYSAAVRDRNYWRGAVGKRAKPKRSDSMIPRIEPAFASAGLPVELVWIAEVESTMDPNAKSPAGAAGLFQLMPNTAKSLGLKLSPTDQRLNPEHNSRAAAKYLRNLYERFGSWPLALAAYNAGEGRVSTLCKKYKTESFDVIAPKLPSETQMYVPRVLETIRLRTGVNPDTLPPPS